MRIINGPKITAKQLAKLLSGAKPPLVVDVREAREFFADRLLPGSVNIPLADLKVKAHELGNQDQLIVLVCDSGKRAVVGAWILRSLGFTNAVVLENGVVRPLMALQHKAHGACDRETVSQASVLPGRGDACEADSGDLDDMSKG